VLIGEGCRAVSTLAVAVDDERTGDGWQLVDLVENGTAHLTVEIHRDDNVTALDMAELSTAPWGSQP
jgi:hypothetical protein